MPPCPNVRSSEPSASSRATAAHESPRLLSAVPNAAILPSGWTETPRAVELVFAADLDRDLDRAALAEGRVEHTRRTEPGDHERRIVLRRHDHDVAVGLDRHSLDEDAVFRIRGRRQDGESALAERGVERAVGVQPRDDAAAVDWSPATSLALARVAGDEDLAIRQCGNGGRRGVVVSAQADGDYHLAGRSEAGVQPAAQGHPRLQPFPARNPADGPLSRLLPMHDLDPPAWSRQMLQTATAPGHRTGRPPRRTAGASGAASGSIRAIPPSHGTMPNENRTRRRRIVLGLLAILPSRTKSSAGRHPQRSETPG